MTDQHQPDPPPPQMAVPVTEWVRAVAREAATQALAAHHTECPIRQIDARLRQVETRTAALWGFMAGSGLLGGIAGAFLQSVIPLP